MTPPNKIIYSGTEDEMELGDRIQIQGIFAKDEFATVTYIPGSSPQQTGILDHQFGYQTDDGRHFITDHEPVEGQVWSIVPKGIKLVQRSDIDAG